MATNVVSNFGKIESVIVNDLYKVLRDSGMKDAQVSMITDTILYMVKRVMDSNRFFDEHGFGSFQDRH